MNCGITSRSKSYDAVTYSVADPFDSIPGMEGELLTLVFRLYPGQPVLEIKAESQSSCRSGAKLLDLRAPLGSAVMWVWQLTGRLKPVKI